MAKNLKDNISALRLSEKTLTFPHDLKNLINDSNNNNISFVMFVPTSPKIIKPNITPVPITSQFSLTDMANKVEMKYNPIGVDAIILPIRPTEDSIMSTWEQKEGMAMFDSGTNATNYLAYKALSGISSKLSENAIIALKSKLFGGGLDNPHDKMIYSGHMRRTFQIAWEFMKPSSKEDEKTLNNIVSIFRMTSMGGYSSTVITPPANWRISFHSLPDYENYLVYKRSAFSNVSVKFGGDGEFHAMKSGMPFLSLSLDVNELDYPSREDVVLKGNSKIL